MARRRGVLATIVQLQREAERDRERRAQAALRAQRAGERAAAAQSRAHMQDQRLRERLYAEDRAREAADDTAELDRQVEALETVLAATLHVDDYLDLEALKQAPQQPVFDPAVVGLPPPPPLLADFLPAAPSGIGRVFGGAKHAEQTQQRQRDYEQAVQAHQAQIRQHTDRLETARRQHAAETARVLQEHQGHVGEVCALQRGLATGDPHAVVRYLDLVLEAAEYPEGFPHRWRMTYTPESRQLVIEYELPPLDVVPAAKAWKYVKSSDSITATARPATQARAMYAGVVMQTALRVVHEVLEADRDSVVRTIVFNGQVSGIDPATGQSIRPCLVAFATSRERFLQVDLARVEPAACLEHLEARVSKNPSKLLGVEPIVLTGTLDSGYAIDTDEAEVRPVPNGAVDGPPPVSPSATLHELVAGQNVPLLGALVEVALPTQGVDLSVILLGSSGRVSRDEDFVFYNNPNSANGAVQLRGGDTPDGATIDLFRLPSQHERLVLVASAGDSSGSAAGAALVIRHADGKDGLSFRSTDHTHVGAMVCAEVYRRDGGWRLRAVGQGWADGLAGLARDYGVDIT